MPQRSCLKNHFLEPLSGAHAARVDKFVLASTGQVRTSEAGRTYKVRPTGDPKTDRCQPVDVGTIPYSPYPGSALQPPTERVTGTAQYLIPRQPMVKLLYAQDPCFQPGIMIHHKKTER